MTAMLAHTKINAAECACAAADSSLLATDLADYLVKKGLPFRKAHHAVGALVAYAESQHKALNQLSLEEFQAVDKTFTADVTGMFNLTAAMERRNMHGAPGTKEVEKQLIRWEKELA